MSLIFKLLLKNLYRLREIFEFSPVIAKTLQVALNPAYEFA